jgi:DNA-directed RNA polymerase subunit M
MDFCPNCGTMLNPKTVESGKQEIMFLVCKKCGYSSKPPADDKIDYKTIPHSPKQMIAVIDKKEDLSVEPTITIECPNCGNNKAYVWQVQTRGADESSTEFMRCMRCGYTFREST